MEKTCPECGENLEWEKDTNIYGFNEEYWVCHQCMKTYPINEEQEELE